MPNVRPLPARVRRQIEDLYHQGHINCNQRLYSAGLRLFYKAWIQLPKPQTDFEVSGKILAAIGNTYFKMEKYPQAVEAFRSSLYCPDTSDNKAPVYMRLGQCLLEMGETAQARIYLLEAHNANGGASFDTEDPKYRLAIDDLV